MSVFEHVCLYLHVCVRTRVCMCKRVHVHVRARVFVRVGGRVEAPNHGFRCTLRPEQGAVVPHAVSCAPTLNRKF